jgi:hypothetical protein
MLSYSENDPLLSVAHAVPSGHRVLVHDTLETAADVVTALRLRGLDPVRMQLPRPFRHPEVRDYSDGFAPAAEVQWALVTVARQQFERAARVCLAHGLHLDPGMGCFTGACVTPPTDRCPGCSAPLATSAERCPECGLRLTGDARGPASGSGS